MVHFFQCKYSGKFSSFMELGSFRNDFAFIQLFIMFFPPFSPVREDLVRRKLYSGDEEGIGEERRVKGCVSGTD